jgi:hypothetical protein
VWHDHGFILLTALGHSVEHRLCVAHTDVPLMVMKTRMEPSCMFSMIKGANIILPFSEIVIQFKIIMKDDST